MVNKDWIIRRANLKDVDALEQCEQQSTEGSVSCDFREKIMEDPVWIAEYNNQLIGAMILHLTKDAIDIKYVVTMPEYKEQGLDRYLIEFAETEALKRRCNTVTITVDKKHHSDLPLYEHLGWEVSRTKKKEVIIQKNVTETIAD